MLWLWVVLGAWIVLACGAAVLIGRSIRRADREELGSTLDWNPADLVSEDIERPRDSRH
ncbi:hypothetical protein AB4Z09_12500 [Rhodococcus sp. TAF43]|uniref:hypothetical protein n=1 Tax=unclassified Rhodococcus (in: high G+C Gram-positive bacteria) TaxID=192944 RepID=UPI000E2A811C|nr:MULTISPECIES: hypothetical protein [unclassified Rhodococcus (in: high G+C Gram-positive bacteria)]QKT13263.1 hypothetical protein HUN07_23275 [Rhodococcus sp. W8901]RDI19004.1 hypothetical protein DEU38_119102 [Rhodococcus sp. AG1013]